MKTKVNHATSDGTITIFRYKVEELEKKLTQQHQIIKTDIAIPLGKDLAGMQPCKPEADAEVDLYSGTISGAYATMMTSTKKELQSEIESHHLVSDKQEAEAKISEFSETLQKKQTDLRLKKRELETCDNSLIKKDKRYRFPIRPLLVFFVLVDTLISGAALQAMGYPLITSYILGLAIGVGIFFFAEYLPELIYKGRTANQKQIIAIAAFGFLFAVFYVLRIFRSTVFNNSEQFENGIKPIYFAGLNLFFTIVCVLVVYFKGLTVKEKKALDQYTLTREAINKLEAEIQHLKQNIIKVRQEQANASLARKQILIYATNLQELIQRFYEESVKTFYSTNCIHRSDGKTPEFFKRDIPKLPSFNNTLNL